MLYPAVVEWTGVVVGVKLILLEKLCVYRAEMREKQDRCDVVRNLFVISARTRSAGSRACGDIRWRRGLRSSRTREAGTTALNPDTCCQ